MGLLGTVTGMVEVFDVMAITGSGNARAMAAGISKATLPTMAGLVVALSGIAFITLLERKAEKSHKGSRRGVKCLDIAHTEEAADINITPMLDIVFIMLIFFIVTATFVKESGIDVSRPDAETATKQNRVGILVAINEHNEVWINGREVDIGRGARKCRATFMLKTHKEVL